MKGVQARIFSVFLLSLLFSFPVRILYAQDTLPRSSPKVLLIHSYHPDYAWVQSITDGVKAAFKERAVILDIFYMDTKRYTSQEWIVSAAKRARNRIAEFKPDVVITADDNAQAFVARQYLNKKPFFVFCGLNGMPEDYGFPADNVSGIIERPFINESLSLLKEIVPSIRTIAVMSDPGRTSLGALTHIRENIQGVKVADYKIVGDFSLWKKRILEFNRRVDAVVLYTYHTLKESPYSPSLDPVRVMGWTRQNMKIPSVGLLDFAIRDGALCGVVESGFEHGLEAGEMALRIIDGEKPGAIPIRTALKGNKMLNLRTARALGLSISERVLRTIDVVVDEK